MANIYQYDAGRNILQDRKKRFALIKKSQNVTSINLFVYVVVMIFELCIGYLNHISVLIADGLNNLTGVISAAILIYGFVLSRKPPDKNHPVGHWQYENISAFLSAAIMFGVSIQIFGEGISAIKKFFQNQTVAPTYWSLGISLVSCIFLFLLAYFNNYSGKKFNNNGLLAAGKDLLSDSLTSLGTFLAIIGAYLGLKWLDGLATILVGIFVLFASFSIFRSTSVRLTEGFNPRLIKKYKKTILQIPEVKGVRSIEPRWLGDQIVMQIGIYLKDNTKMYTCLFYWGKG